MSEPVPLLVGHVRLVLVRTPPHEFCLDIPLSIINSLCHTPRKYLAFLGWCILGVVGELVDNPEGTPLALVGALNDQGIYYYHVSEETCTGRLSSS
jgi:hypothetical protein